MWLFFVSVYDLNLKKKHSFAKDRLNFLQLVMPHLSCLYSTLVGPAPHFDRGVGPRVLVHLSEKKNSLKNIVKVSSLQICSIRFVHKLCI